MRPTRVFVFTFAALLLFQACWILVVPPFRGADEYRHVYKAWAVAHGDFSPTHRAAPAGNGSLVVVDRSLVQAALPVCESLHLTDDYCPAAGGAGGDNVYASTTAATYDPLYYLVIGTAGRWWHGYAALYAMRIATALLCALLLAAAAATSARWAHTRWPLVALIAAMSPEVVYSTSIVSPNGVEMALAALVWAALLGLCRARSPDRWYLTVATAASVPLVMVRSLGPFWLALIVGIAALVAGRERMRALLRVRTVWVGVALLCLATAAAAAWTLTARANFPLPAGSPHGSLTEELVVETVLWIGQAYAAFPRAVEFAPGGVYVAEVVLLAAAAAAVLRCRVRGTRAAILAIAAGGILTPLVATIATWHDGGVLWQGRYALPLLIGFFLVAGFALDAAEAPRARLGLAAVALLTTVAQILSVAHVRGRQLATSPLAHTQSWVTAPLVVIAGLAFLGAVVLVAGVVRAVPGRTAA